MLNHLKDLSNLIGVSGDENKVREYIIENIKDKCEYKIDNLGNIIAFKKGKNKIEKKIMFAAHMDEVGMIVNYINDDGTLKISPVGGLDAEVVIGRSVIVSKNNMKGVIGSKAVHNLSSEEKKSSPKFDNLYVDIGSQSKEETDKYINLGDTVAFMPNFMEFGDDKIKSKALDDRIGCAIMLDLISDELEYDAYFAFTVQEELGLRGARTATYDIEPDFAIVLETTTASDIPSVSEEKVVCKLGKGAVVSYMDRSTIYDKELYSLAFEISKSNNILCQTKTAVVGGNDSGAIHISRKGVRTIAISAPSRYLHSPASVVKKSDLISCENLAKMLFLRIANI